MNKSTTAFKELNFKKLLLRICLAFAIGVLAVLTIIYISNKQVEKFAAYNSKLDVVLNNCYKQRTLSQFLTKNALLLQDDIQDQELIIKKLDSALLLFNKNHNALASSNRDLKQSVDLDLNTVDSLYNRLAPIISALIRSSYGIQEANNIANFKAKMLEHEQSFLPLMTALTDEYHVLLNYVDHQLENTISKQYWLLGLVVVCAASLVFLFTSQLVRIKIKQNRASFEDLVASKDRYESLINGTQEIVYELNKKGQYTYVNPAFSKLTGYSLEEANKRTWLEHIPTQQREEIVSYFGDLIKRKESACYREFPVIISSGEERWIAQSSDFSYSPEGELIKIYNIARDITDERKSSVKEEKYKEGLRLLNDLNAKSEMSIQDRLKDGLKLCLDFLGLEVGIVSKIWMDEYQIEAFYPESSGLSKNQKFKLGDTYCDITLAQKGKVLSIDDMSVSQHMGHPCFENFKLQSYIGSAYRVDGKVAGTVNFTSVEPRKEPFTAYEIDFISLVGKWVGSLMELQDSQAKLIQEQNLLKTFVASAPAAMAMFDKHMNYISASERWKKDQNIKGDIIGKSHYRVFPEIPTKWKKLHKRALSGEVIKPGIEKFERADGSIQWLKGEIHPWYTSKDKVGGIIIFINDLTEMKRQEQELRKAKEEAEAAGKIKEQFLSTMSHEIRTPLNAIIGTTHLLELEHPELTDSNRLKMLKFGSNNLLTLINDILDFQKIAAGHLEIVESDVNFKELCENVINTWKAVPNENEVELKLNFSDKLNFNYRCDEIRLTQVLNNLLSNALKFTNEGSVELTVKPTKNKGILFSVKDTGIGIPEDKLETIFESFKQINSQEALRKGGTGLGLSISKRLVEMMGGELNAKSKIGKGATFYFELSLIKSSAAITDKNDVIPKDVSIPIHVLLVEDNLANQEIAKSFLTRWGVQVELANNGQEAVEKIESKAFDLMLIDVRMPVMDGYEATRRIRNKRNKYFKDLPIIALTASTLSESKSKMKECGMNEIVSKPFDPADLYEKVSRLSKRKMDPVSEVQQEENPDFIFLNEVLGGDQQKIIEIANMTVESIERDVKGSQEAFELKDRNKAHDHLHKMKSNLAHLDLKEISDRVPDHKAEHFWDELDSYLVEVRGSISEVKENLNRLVD
ncbi:ATP-binding protein [Ekhidna sp.]|uniref:ATP-binding protein n=1 Tax=Ekhidna sp. TaxID=2608089 RepID=UPI003CCBE726